MNVAEPIWRHAREAPERPALRGGGSEWTYGQLAAAAGRFGAALAANGVGPGDRVMLMAPSVPEFVIAYLGIQAIGAVAVTPNVMSTPAELEYLLVDAGAKRVLAWHEAATAAEEIARAEGLPFQRLLPGLQGALGAAAVEWPREAEADDLALLLYTSGTTGKPKGAEITNGNLRACAEVFGEVLELGPEDRFGTALPLFHIFGQAVVLGSALMAGAGVSLQARFDPEALVEMVRRDRVTVLAGVPTMYSAMLGAAAECGADDFVSLRLAASGGASLPAEVMRRFVERFGCAILEGYGLTESTGAATFNGLHRERKVGSVGIALPGTVVRIVNAAGIGVPAGEVGEILIKGPMVMKGYWNRAQETEKTLREGWLYTGDLGRKDADGDIELVDRLKEMIVRGGYNVYPREVEEVLYQHPEIAEVAVIGVPDDHFGEEVGAAVVLVPDAMPDPEAIRAWAKQRLSAYKVPRLFTFTESLPKGPTGKILKRTIARHELRSMKPDAVRNRSARRHRSEER
ncbi:MAG: long-chain fatty acid--CoA ligase [Solirubrobacterales bacterium]|nr:long-chain fatty acid--CoA ligase [Solirubrobacterales bacterium]